MTASAASVPKTESAVKDTPAQPQYQQTKQISLDDAIDIAVKDANVLRANAKLTETKTDKDGSTEHYDIEFIAGLKEYDYEIAVEDGRIIKKEIESVASAAEKSAETKPAKIGYISVDDAKSAALKSAKLKESQVTFKKAKLSTDDRTANYEIEFVSGKTEYEFEINANTGAVIKAEKERAEEKTNTARPTVKGKYITLDEAKSIALKKVGLTSSKVNFKKAKLTSDDGVAQYDIEFVHGAYEYDFEIGAKDGKILDYDKEIRKTEPAPASKADYITAQTAKNIALAHAKLDASQVKKLEAELDKDGSDAYYEVEFKYARYEYEYKINAKTGKIIFSEKERD